MSDFARAARLSADVLVFASKTGTHEGERRQSASCGEEPSDEGCFGSEAAVGLCLSLFDEHNLAEIASDDYPDERLVVCRNPLVARERRESQIARRRTLGSRSGLERARRRSPPIERTMALIDRLSRRIEGPAPG